MDGSLNVTISDADADGICLAKVFEDGQHIASFETTQAEMKVLVLQLTDNAVSPAMLADAEAEEARRVALGRTLQEDVTTLATISISVPVADLSAEFRREG